MMKYVLALLLAIGAASAEAQTTANQTTPGYMSPAGQNGCPSTGACWIPYGATVPVSGTFSATLSGFSPTSVGTPISATTLGVTGTLPAGAVVVATNVGSTNGAYCALGAATSSAQQYIAPGGGWFAFTVGAATQLTCQSTASTTTINMVGGTGLPTGIGGTSGGSSGGTSSAFSAAFPANGTAIGLSDGTNMQSWLTALALADGVNGNNTGAVAQWLFNGTTWDRQRGDATNGAWTNVKTSALPTGAATSANQTSQITQETSTATNTGTIAGAVTANVMQSNTKQVNGVTTLAGAGAVGTGAQRVAVGQDTTTIAGSAPGTAGSASANVVSVQGIAGMTKIQVTPDALPANQSVNVSQVGGTNTVSGGVAGSMSVGGPTASGSSFAANPLPAGGRAQTAEATAVANGQAVAAAFDVAGKQIVMPYANKENFVSGCASATATSGTSIIAAQGVGVKIYVTSVSTSNTGASASLITVQSDPTGTPVTMWQTIDPAGGGSNQTFPVPIVSGANKAVGFTAGTSSTTQYVCVSGYIGS